MPAAVEGSPAMQAPDMSEEAGKLTELSLYDLIVHHFGAEYHVWPGSVDLLSDEQLELDPKYQEDVDREQQGLDEVQARSDADWQRKADEQYDEAMRHWQEAEDEPEPAVPAVLQARLDEVKALRVPNELNIFKRTLLDSVLRVVPSKTRLVKPTKDDWQELKQDSIEQRQKDLKRAQERLDSERIQVERDNAFVQSLRKLLGSMKEQAS